MTGLRLGLVLIVAATAGCAGITGGPGPEEIDFDGGQPDLAVANSTAPEPASLPLDELYHSDTVVLRGCYGSEVVATDSSETSPWSPPEGWEEPYVWKADYFLFILECEEVDNGGLEVLKGVSLVFDGHNNLDVPQPSPIAGRYDSLMFGLSAYVSHDSLAAWWPSAEQKRGEANISLVDGGRAGATADLGGAALSLTYPEVRNLGEGSQVVTYIWVSSVEPLVYLKIEEVWRGDQLAVVGDLHAEEELEAAKLRQSPAGASGLVPAGAILGADYVLTKVVQE